MGFLAWWRSELGRVQSRAAGFGAVVALLLLLYWLAWWNPHSIAGRSSYELMLATTQVLCPPSRLVRPVKNAPMAVQYLEFAATVVANAIVYSAVATVTYTALRVVAGRRSDASE